MNPKINILFLQFFIFSNISAVVLNIENRSEFPVGIGLANSTVSVLADLEAYQNGTMTIPVIENIEYIFIFQDPESKISTTIEARKTMLIDDEGYTAVIYDPGNIELICPVGTVHNETKSSN